jgi:hypothetical protein
MKIFISYRRQDTREKAKRLHTKLVTKYGAKSVFMDTARIKGGQDFSERIRKEIAKSYIFLILIGKEWLSVLKARQRSSDEDYVVMEISNALQGGGRVIPVLFDGATMPTKNDLPKEIRDLAKRHAISIPVNNFNKGADKLIDNFDSFWWEVVEVGGKVSYYAMLVSGIGGFFIPILFPFAMPIFLISWIFQFVIIRLIYKNILS